jgi:hypothetical protein
MVKKDGKLRKHQEEKWNEPLFQHSGLRFHFWRHESRLPAGRQRHGHRVLKKRGNHEDEQVL